MVSLNHMRQRAGLTVLVCSSVRGFPTFRFFLGNKQVDEVVGASAAKIEETIKRHMTKPTVRVPPV